MAGDGELGSLSDEQLIRRFRGGDSAAGEALCDRYRHVMYAIAWSAGQDPDSVEDTVCEISCRVLRSLPSFRGDSEFGVWFRAVARRAYVDELRKRHRWRKERAAVAYSGTGSSDDPADLAAERDLQERSLKGLRRLPEKTRTAMVLRFVKGHSYRQIAQALDVPIGTVKSRISYGLSKLRTMLGGRNSGGD